MLLKAVIESIFIVLVSGPCVLAPVLVLHLLVLIGWSNQRLKHLIHYCFWPIPTAVQCTGCMEY